MTFEIVLHPKAHGFLERMEKKIASRIRDKLKALMLDPSIGEPLNLGEFRRIRIGDHRAIYEIDRKEERVIVLFIGHRKDVYDDFSRLV